MVKQYVGARYVPKFASPVEWASNTSYEALTIVTYNNSSYTSKIPVPATVGDPADNPDYWALTGNYNAQVEQYRQEVDRVTEQINSILKNLTYDTPENHGASGDGTTDDTTAVQAAINSGKPVFGAKTYKVTSITIPAYAIVFINSITSEVNGAVKIDSGAYGIIAINRINSTGDCVQFINSQNNLVDRAKFFFGILTGNDHAINFLNAGGVLDSTISGDTWQTDEHAFYVSDNTAYVGQMNIKCNRILSKNGYSIYLDCNTVPLTGFNFNYCSLEGTHSGIYVNMSNNFEPIYGNFRIRENLYNGNPMLTITSKALNNVNLASHIHFDFLMPDQVDLSGLATSLIAYYNNRPIFFIDGDLYHREDEYKLIATHISIGPTGMRYQPVSFRKYVPTTSTTVSPFPADKTGYGNAVYIATSGGTTAITLPRFWDGTYLIHLELAEETTIYMYYSTTEYSSITLPQGKHSITAWYDLVGVSHIEEI